MPQQSALEYIRSGQTPFFRLPCADPHGLAGVDAALIGVTFDAGTTYQPGARLAPYHLRRVSALVQPVHPVHGVDVFERVRTVDAGNVACASSSVRRSTVGPFPLRSTPTTPVPPTPVVTSYPSLRSSSAMRAEVRCSFNDSSGFLCRSM